MGYGTYLYSEIYFSRENFTDKYQVKDRIEETKDYISLLRSRLLTFAMMTEPKKFCESDQDPMYWIDSEVTDILDELEEHTIALYKYELLLMNWDDSHDKESGKAIGPPIEWGSDSKAFVRGDFIENVNDVEDDGE